MDTDVISIQRISDSWENAIVSEELDLSNAMLKFRRGHPALADTCKKMVSCEATFHCLSRFVMS